MVTVVTKSPSEQIKSKKKTELNTKKNRKINLHRGTSGRL